VRTIGVLISCWVMLVTAGNAEAEEADYNTQATAETVDNAVRVLLLKQGGAYDVESVSSGGSEARQGCSWTLIFAPALEDAPYGTSPGPKPHLDARFALLLCDGSIVRAIWVAPDDVVDLDAAARAEAERYLRDVLAPAVSIGVNPSARGLAGLRSWFWIDGFGGTLTAPPISAFGLTIDVRMSSGSVTWDFGDGAVEQGDLGRAYPEESTVQHAHRDAGSYTITATIDLVPEYRVDGGPWTTLPNLSTSASTTHAVEQRQPVITET
jgi:hypothetical protein